MQIMYEKALFMKPNVIYFILKLQVNDLDKTLEMTKEYFNLYSFLKLFKKTDFIYNII